MPGGLLDRQIRQTDEQIARMDDRLAPQEERLYRQFGEMEAAIARMQTQSQFLSSQLAALLGGTSPATRRAP